MSDVSLQFDAKRTVRAVVDMNFDARNIFPASEIDYSDLSISLNSHTLSDTYEMTVPKGNLNFDYLVEGSLLDLNYEFRVEGITERNKMMTYEGRYSSDKLLFTNYRLSVPYRKTSEEPSNPSYSVRALMQKMCNHLGLYLSYQAMDWYYPLNKLNEDEHYWYYGLSGTYQSLISSLFGWLSQLPHIDFNVFIRDGILYVLQRGHEDGGTVTINKTVYPPTINKRRIRTEWQGSGNTQQEKTFDDDEQVPFTGTIRFGDIYRTYEEGYLVEEMDSQSNETKYYYIELNKQKYLSRKLVENSQTHGSTEVVYQYKVLGNEVFLIQETQTVTTVEGTPPETVTTTEVTVTEHAPIGNGWFGHTVKDVEGNVVQTSISQGSSANSVSPYMVNKTQGVFNTMTQQIVADVIAGLLEYLHPPLIGTNYPVTDRNTIEYLIDQTDWLNNRIEEKVTLEVVGIDHVIDFNDVISYGGNSYKLESNHIRHDAESGISQSLTIVRWY